MSVYRPTYVDPKTGERKHSDTWWIEFTFAGKRIRESAKTSRKTLAIQAEKQKRLELERALTGMPTERLDNRIRTVSDALAGYAKNYGVNHREKSALRVRAAAAHLVSLLGPVLLPDLRQDRITDYMIARRDQGASNRTINIELAVLSRAVGHTWTALWPNVKKLEENRDVGRALEPEEEKALLDAAARNRSRLIYPYLMTLAWTGMRADEARLLTWGQVDFEAVEVVVGRAKTKAGTKRVIPMGAPLRAALEHHASWYSAAFGVIQPDWYVFPLSNRLRPVDPTRPVTSLKRAWQGVRDKSKVNCRQHDLRHSFCTKLAEAAAPEQAMLDMMGHVSAAMLRRYTHIRAKARRDAIAALEQAASSFGVPKENPKVTAMSAGGKVVTH